MSYISEIKAPSVNMIPVDPSNRMNTVAALALWNKVIAEYRNPNHCTTCTPWGRAGQVPVPIEEHGKVVEIRWDTCPICAGSHAL